MCTNAHPIAIARLGTCVVSHHSLQQVETLNRLKEFDHKLICLIFVSYCVNPVYFKKVYQQVEIYYPNIFIFIEFGVYGLDLVSIACYVMPG